MPEAIVIHIGGKSDGYAYELRPDSRERVAAEPKAQLVRMVFIGFDTKEDFETIHGPIEWQVATLLTGLSKADLVRLGGVRLYDPRTQLYTDLKP